MNNKTLRDEFAMAALQGITSSPRASYNAANEPISTPRRLAEFSYTIADAMLEARKEREE